MARGVRYPNSWPSRRVPRRGTGAAGRPGPPLPSAFFFTDPDRAGDLDAALEALPAGTGVIYRAFGRPGSLERGRRLVRIARARGLRLLVGADEALAAALKADGLHLPERRLAAAWLIRRRRPLWILTGAAHSGRALRRARALPLDAIFLSPVFPSRSPSASRPMGALRFAGLLRLAKVGAYALGGVDEGGARRLRPLGALGFGAVEAFAQRPGGKPPPERRVPAPRTGTWSRGGPADPYPGG